MVPFDEIADAKNDYNLNLPRYIDTREPKTCRTSRPPQRRHSRARHRRHIDAIPLYRAVTTGRSAPICAAACSAEQRPGYADLAVEQAAIKPAIHQHPEFAAFIKGMHEPFDDWRERNRPSSRASASGRPAQGTDHPTIGEDLLDHLRAAPRPARPLRHLPAPDGLLGRDHAGRLLPNRCRWLGGRTAACSKKSRAARKRAR